MEALDDLRAVLVAGGVLHLGFATVALAYVFRDVLSLRVLAAAGYGLFLVHSLPGADLGGRVEAGWYALFMALNAGHAAVLAYERRCASLTPDERRLSGLAFASVDVGAARRMMRRGSWHDLPAGTVLARQGEQATALYAVLAGRVDILVDDLPVATAGPGEFVGEIGFLAGGPATGSAVVAAPVRALVWQRGELERAMRRTPELHATAYAAFGSDLARKVAQQSLRPRRAQSEVEAEA
jgi:CRP-like cAMP-binding protein